MGDVLKRGGLTRADGLQEEDGDPNKGKPPCPTCWRCFACNRVIHCRDDHAFSCPNRPGQTISMEFAFGRKRTDFKLKG